MLVSIQQDLATSKQREAELRQSLPDAFESWSAENRAAYLELTTLLPSYLLSSQGDRMAISAKLQLATRVTT